MFFSDASTPVVFNIGDVRTRHTKNLNIENTKPFFGDPEDPSAAALKVCTSRLFSCKNLLTGSITEIKIQLQMIL